MKLLGEWYWTGENEPPENTDTFSYEPLTEEEKKQVKESKNLKIFTLNGGHRKEQMKGMRKEDKSTENIEKK